MATPFASEVVGLRPIHQRASVVRCAEFGELHCKLGHEVLIELSLQCGVSRKREYFGMRPETFGLLAPQIAKSGAQRLSTELQKPAIGGRFLSSYG
jgi:hypothetical protein